MDRPAGKMDAADENYSIADFFFKNNGGRSCGRHYHITWLWLFST